MCEDSKYVYKLIENLVATLKLARFNGVSSSDFDQVVSEADRFLTRNKDCLNK
jgi:hypothetical protein